jgi:hypothetical protein
MKKKTYFNGVPNVKWGIYNTKAKQFQFGICEDSPYKAQKALSKKIGNDARKWRFEPKQLPKMLRITALEKDDTK